MADKNAAKMGVTSMSVDDILALAKKAGVTELDGGKLLKLSIGDCVTGVLTKRGHFKGRQGGPVPIYTLDCGNGDVYKVIGNASLSKVMEPDENGEGGVDVGQVVTIARAGKDIETKNKQSMQDIRAFLRADLMSK